MDDQQDPRQGTNDSTKPRDGSSIPVGGIVRGIRIAGITGSTFWIVVGVIVGITLVTFILTLSVGETVGLPTEQAPTTATTGGGGSPITISGTGETCIAPHAGRGPCSIDNLTKSFGGDRSKAIIASLICESESGSDPFAPNKTCSSGDYSIGLFQINAVYNCPGAYSHTDPPSQACLTLISPEKRAVCENDWYNVDKNIAKMLEMSSGGKNWQGIWSTWLHSGKIGIPVQDLLIRCGGVFSSQNGQE